MQELTSHSMPQTRARDPDLVQLPRVLWRHKWLIVGTVALGLIAARVFIASLDPVYRASAQIMIAPEQPVLDVQAVAAALRGDAESTASEVYVLRSMDLALRVVDALNLVADPEFNPALAPVERTWWTRVGGFGLPQIKAGASPREALTPEQQRTRAGGLLLARLEAIPQGRSRVISVSAHASTPQKAALLANTVVQEYLASQVDTKRSTAGSANTWLASRTRELEEEVRSREAAVEAFRAREGLLRGAGAERLSDEEASSLSTQLVLAGAERAAARARLGEVEKLAASGNATAVSDILDAPLVRTLREQQAELRRTVAQMGEEYGSRHPRVISAQAQLRDTDNAIRAEVAKLVQQLRNEAAVATARERAIAASLDALKRQKGRQSTSEVQLRALERDAETSRVLLETFLARTKETAAQSTHVLADARMISRAVPQLAPSFPNSRLLLIIAGAGSLFLGVLLALLREGMDRTVRTRNGLEQLLGVSALGALPLLPGRWRRGQPARWVLRAPYSQYSEALRRVHTELVLADMRDPPRVALFASALPGEGKTSTVLALGRLLAGTGQRVLAVDLNLRKPTLHRAAGLEMKAGIGEWFDAPDEEAPQIHRDPLSPLRLLPAGRVSADPGVLLGSDRFASLLEAMRAQFDVVLLDSSPVLAVVDAQILACLADATVLLVRAGQTPGPSAAEAFALLTRARGVVPYVVLNAARQREAVPAHGQGLSAYYQEAELFRTRARRPLGALPMPVQDGPGQ